MAYFALCIGISAPSWFIYETGFLTQKPEYTCVYVPGVVIKPACTQENICADDPDIESWGYDYGNLNTLHNWQ